MKRTIILAIACVAMIIGDLVLGPPMLAKPPLPASTAQGISAISPRNASSAVQQPNASPKRYLILLDMSGSMSWNMAGEGTVAGNNVNCEWGGSSQLNYKPGCTGPKTP